MGGEFYYDSCPNCGHGVEVDYNIERGRGYCEYCGVKLKVTDDYRLVAVFPEPEPEPDEGPFII